MENNRKQYMKKWREANKEKLKITDGERSKKWYYDNLGLAKAKSKEYYQKNKEKIKTKSKENKKKRANIEKEYQKKYRELNKQKRNLKDFERRQNDLLYKLSCYVRSSINQAFRRKNYTKKSKTYEILGCTYEEFKNHIESLWEPWMTWDNYGQYNGKPNYGWDLDHIIPLSSAVTEEDVIRLNHYTNLQPLCSKINRDIKKDNIIF